MNTSARASEDSGPASLTKIANNFSINIQEDSEAGTSISASPHTQPESGQRQQCTLDWDGLNDHDNPYIWSTFKKGYHLLVPTVLAFIISIGASIYSPSSESIATEFHEGIEISRQGFTLYAIGLACGSVIGSPASELSGRKPVYLVSAMLFSIFTISTRFSKSIAAVLVCRMFARLLGGPALAVGARTVADLWSSDSRAIPMTIFNFSQMAAGFGPVIGAYINTYKGWRWGQWVLLFFTAGSYGFLFFTHETYKRAILNRRATLRGLARPDCSAQAVFKNSMGLTLLRPVHMLVTEAIVLSFGVYCALTWLILFGFLPAIPMMFLDIYQFSSPHQGLPFLGIATGCLLAVPTLIIIDKLFYQPRHRASLNLSENGVDPDYRLYGTMVGSLGLPLSLFWFAWTARSQIHWLVPIAALVSFRVGQHVYLHLVRSLPGGHAWSM